MRFLPLGKFIKGGLLDKGNHWSTATNTLFDSIWAFREVAVLFYIYDK